MISYMWYINGCSADASLIKYIYLEMSQYGIYVCGFFSPNNDLKILIFCFCDRCLIVNIS